MFCYKTVVNKNHEKRFIFILLHITMFFTTSSKTIKISQPFDIFLNHLKAED